MKRGEKKQHVIYTGRRNNTRFYVRRSRAREEVWVRNADISEKNNNTLRGKWFRKPADASSRRHRRRRNKLYK